jgi:hypothetical protein
VRGDGNQKVKDNGETNNQVERKKKKETNKRSFKDIKRERQGTNEP